MKLSHSAQAPSSTSINELIQRSCLIRKVHRSRSSKHQRLQRSYVRCFEKEINGGRRSSILRDLANWRICYLFHFRHQWPLSCGLQKPIWLGDTPAGVQCLVEAPRFLPATSPGPGGAQTVLGAATGSAPYFRWQRESIAFSAKLLR